MTSSLGKWTLRRFDKPGATPTYEYLEGGQSAMDRFIVLQIHSGLRHGLMDLHDEDGKQWALCHWGWEGELPKFHPEMIAGVTKAMLDAAHAAHRAASLEIGIGEKAYVSPYGYPLAAAIKAAMDESARG